MMKYFLLLIALSLKISGFAGHLLGGEMYYNYEGGSTYRFFITVYRDCNPMGNWAEFDNELKLAVYSSGVQVQTKLVPYPGKTNVPITYESPCITISPNICVEKATYETVLNLPPTAAGYTISYQRCCRKPEINNISNPGDVGFTLTSYVPGSANNLYQNSSPRFNNTPPTLLCNNDELVSDQSASDPDGDQITYSLVTPYLGGTNMTPNPMAVAPPYYLIPWAGGFSGTNPLGPGASIQIDPNTGVLIAAPQLTGFFGIGILATERRNGTIINQTLLDFTLEVQACQISLSANLPNQEELPTFVSYCNGLTVDFVNQSWGTNNYLWDFGVPGTNTDTSTETNPSFTYPAPGTYDVLLTANPNQPPCTDTAHMTVIVNNVLEVEWTTTDSICELGNSFDFTANVVGDTGYDINWDFGPHASIQSASNTLNVNNVEFDTYGFIPVTAEVELNVCHDVFTDSIFIFQFPHANAVMPDSLECQGMTINFENETNGAFTQLWDFGVPNLTTDTSNEFEPTYTYPEAGNYNVTLITESLPGCSDTSVTNINIYDKLEVFFESKDEDCITDNSFDFDATVEGPNHAIYSWDFGPNASTLLSNELDVYGVEFNTPGYHTITLTGSHDMCLDSFSKDIYIYSSPQIDFTVAPGLQCAPYTADFINLSTSETPMYFLWDFGDHSMSNEFEPNHLYETPGPYPVSLTLWTTEGCIDTLHLTQEELIHVRPNPTAAFSLSPDYTDICHSKVQFTDASIGATKWRYWFDDETASSKEINPEHVYLSDGTLYPSLLVENDWGCTDSTFNKLIIEPFNVFAPNSFTPDGDAFNNVFNPIVYLDVHEWKLEIFDRWGEKLFESNDPDIGWDGTYSGNIVQSGTYTWKLSLVSCEPSNPEKMLTGHVTVLK